jgi:hypothetical protein
MAKRVPRFVYPTPVDRRGGCKVSWNYYDNEADAKQASAVAIQEAEYVAELGYDFGYCSPGSIALVNGRYEVCLP